MLTAIMADRNTTIDYVGHPNANSEVGIWPTSVGMAVRQDRDQETQGHEGQAPIAPTATNKMEISK
jgi:hypothetical protein